MPDFPVSAQSVSSLREQMARLGIHEEDLQESFVRSSGAGGQNVNKVSTCVVLFHEPTKLSVRCQSERSQGLNRFLARRLLCEKLEEKVLGEKSAKRQAIEKVRRQKRRRSRRSKERMLAEKRQQSERKALRGRFQGED